MIPIVSGICILGSQVAVFFVKAWEMWPCWSRRVSVGAFESLKTLHCILLHCITFHTHTECFQLCELAQCFFSPCSKLGKGIRLLTHNI